MQFVSRVSKKYYEKYNSYRQHDMKFILGSGNIYEPSPLLSIAQKIGFVSGVTYGSYKTQSTLYRDHLRNAFVCGIFGTISGTAYPFLLSPPVFVILSIPAISYYIKK